MESSYRFVPARSEGLTGVEAVVVYPNRLVVHLDAAPRVRVFFFAEIARIEEPWWTWIRMWLRGQPPTRVVGDRDCFRPPQERFFRWYTTPTLTTYMRGEDGFPEIQEVLNLGDYVTADLA